MRSRIAMAGALLALVSFVPAAEAKCRTDDCWERVREARAQAWSHRHLECRTPQCNRRLGWHMAKKRWDRHQAGCLVALGARESGWHHRKGYGGYIGPPGRVAWGIPQALPPQKMRSQGRDWATNPVTQIRWMMSYVRRSYGSACAANAFQASHNWY